MDQVTRGTHQTLEVYLRRWAVDARGPRSGGNSPYAVREGRYYRRVPPGRVPPGDVEPAGEPDVGFSGQVVAGYIRQLEEHGQALGAAAGAAGLDAAVPSCPGWSVRHLLAHVGYVHRWAGTHVGGALSELAEGVGEEEIYSRRPPDDELLEWYQAGHATLVDTLRRAPADLQCWTFMAAPSPLAFWARRQAHETAVHRVDAELAAGRSTGTFEEEFAIDGIDELLWGFAPRKPAQRSGTTPWSLGVAVEGAPYRWTVVVGTEAVTATRAAGTADCTVWGPAHELYLALWNRPSAGAGLLRTQGDPSALERWATFMHVEW
jgi:uncharacterized protein (TIGR03083 family)